MELSREQLELIVQAAFDKGRLSVVDAPEVVKSWDESLHPRGDDGRFINKDEISQAARNPAKAAELRKRVTDPQERGKLDRAIDNRSRANQSAEHGVDTSSFGEGLDVPANPPRRRRPPDSRQPHGSPDVPEHPSVHETAALARGLRDKTLDQSARQQLAERLQSHTVDELQEIKKHLGIRATGRKAELASKILMAASGHEYPEQGFTGALPVRGQGVHHYEDGQLVRIEREPSPGMYASRVTPEEAHAVIDYYVSKGTLLKKSVREEIAAMLMNRMSYRDIADLKRRLGLKASGRKQVFAEKIQRLVEDQHREKLSDPSHPVNQPDPMGTMGSLAERQDYMASMKAVYGDGVHPDRQKHVDDAADRLGHAIESPFSSWGKDSALGEVKAALNDLHNAPEMRAAATKAGLKLDPKDGKLVQQVAAAVFRLAGGVENPAADEKMIGEGAVQHITPAHHTHSLTGAPGVTYKYREDIKNAGGVWNAKDKVWTIDEGARDFLPKEIKMVPMPKDGRESPAGPSFDQFAKSKPESHTLRITGDTFANRQAIAKAGGWPDKVGKFWTIDEDGAKLLPEGLATEPLEHRQPMKPVDSKGEGLRRVAENIASGKDGKAAAEDFIKEVGYRESAPWQRSLVGRTLEDDKVIAGHLRTLLGRDSEPATEPEKPATIPEPAKPADDSRSDHLAAVASGATREELRDAADTVSRIEDIPHGERTADDRAELKRAKELAAANDVSESDTSRPKNPAQYVDDHPEVTADNPLGLPMVANSAEKSDDGLTQHVENNLSSSVPKEHREAIHRYAKEGLELGNGLYAAADEATKTAKKSNGADDAALKEVGYHLAMQHRENKSKEVQARRKKQQADQRMFDRSLRAAAVSGGEFHESASPMQIEDAKQYGEAFQKIKKYLDEGGTFQRANHIRGEIYEEGKGRYSLDEKTGDIKLYQNKSDGGPVTLTQSEVIDMAAGIKSGNSKTAIEDNKAEPDSHAAKLADLEAKMAEAKAGENNKSTGKGDRAVWARHHDELEDQHHALTGRVRTLAEHEQQVARAKKRKDNDRLATLEGQAAKVHAQHIDNHLSRLDKRIAKMDEANSWANHVAREHGKIAWDGEMETVYSDQKEAMESGMPKHLFADASKGEKGSSIDQIAQSLESSGDLQVPSDRNATDYLIEKLSSGETFDGGRDEHRQKLAAEWDAIHSERDGKPETDAAIVATLKEGKTPKGKAKPEAMTEPAGTNTNESAAPKVADVKQHSLDEIMASAAGKDAGPKEEQPNSSKLDHHEKQFRAVLDRIGSDAVTSADIDGVENGLKELTKDELAELMPRLKVSGKPKSKSDAIRQITNVLRNQLIDNVKYGTAAKRSYGWSPDTATTHGQASAVPIGVTQTDDYETRGRGVKKSATVESEYLLPL